MTTTKEDIIESLAPLFQRAERDGLWFHCTYQDLWFSPKELRAEHVKGSFIWASMNWTLRNPEERLRELIAEQKAAENNVRQFLERSKI